MGTNAVKLIYKDGSFYEGDVNVNQPDGKGKITVKRKKQEKDRIFTIQGQFKKEKLIKLHRLVSENDQLVLTGVSDRNLNFSAEVVIKGTNNFKAQGILKEGSIVKGKIDTPQYHCEGEWPNGKLQGKCIYKNHISRDKLSGNFINSQLNGEDCAYKFGNGEKYEGGMEQGCRIGRGKYSGKGFVYDGNFERDEFTGEGEVTFANGDHYKGEFKGGEFCGSGTYTFKNQTKYSGQFYYGKMEGVGTLTYKKGEIEQYEGELSEGLYHGIGTIYYSNGVIFKGNFHYGCKNGPGIIVYETDIFKCLFVMNRLIGPLTRKYLK